MVLHLQCDMNMLKGEKWASIEKTIDFYVVLGNILYQLQY